MLRIASVAAKADSMAVKTNTTVSACSVAAMDSDSASGSYVMSVSAVAAPVAVEDNMAVLACSAAAMTIDSVFGSYVLSVVWHS